jgi:hypothetical protein
MLVPPAFWRFQILYSLQEMFGGEFCCYGTFPMPPAPSGAVIS